MLTCGDLLYCVIFFSNDYFSFLLFSVGNFLKVCTESSAFSAAAVVSVYICCHLSSLYTFLIQGSILALSLTVFLHSAFTVSQYFFSGAPGQKDHGLFCIPSLPLCAIGTVLSFLLKATYMGTYSCNFLLQPSMYSPPESYLLLLILQYLQGSFFFLLLTQVSYLVTIVRRFE